MESVEYDILNVGFFVLFCFFILWKKYFLRAVFSVHNWESCMWRTNVSYMSFFDCAGSGHPCIVKGSTVFLNKSTIPMSYIVLNKNLAFCIVFLVLKLYSIFSPQLWIRFHSFVSSNRNMHWRKYSESIALLCVSLCSKGHLRN